MRIARKQRGACALLIVSLFTNAAGAEDRPARQPVDSSGAPDGIPGYGPPPTVMGRGSNGTRSGWLLASPIQRVVDFSAIVGIPDLVGLCVEANPFQTVSAELCGGTTRQIATSSLQFKWRFLHYQSFDYVGDRVESGWQFSAGPGAGIRAWREIDIPGQNPSPSFLSENSSDLLFSLEWVNWWSARLGLTMQVDLGSSWRQSPLARVSFGLAFGLPRDNPRP